MIASLFVEQRDYDRRFSETHRCRGKEEIEVRVIEWNKETANWARESISRHGFSENDIRVILQDDITIGSGDEGYWTTIIMNGSIPKIPYPLLDQLDDEEGRMLFFMQDTADRAQTCWLIKKNELIQEVKQETLESSTNTIQSGA